MHGTLLIPDGNEMVVGALIIAGSGPTDRDGNQPNMRNDSLKLLAEGLSERGIASMRFDKRGVAESLAASPPERDLRFETYVDDAVEWTERLARVPRVSRVVIAGHAEWDFRKVSAFT